MEGLQTRIRNHITWSQKLANLLNNEQDFEVVTQPVLSLFSFRFLPTGENNPDELNSRLLEAINDDGSIYLTQSNHDGDYVIRFVAGQFDMQESDIDVAFETITRVARSL